MLFCFFISVISFFLIETGYIYIYYTPFFYFVLDSCGDVNLIVYFSNQEAVYVVSYNVGMFVAVEIEVYVISLFYSRPIDTSYGF